MKNQKLIPSQRILGSNKELFIIKYEGSVIEIFRTNNLYEPLVIQINGVQLDTIPSKKNKEIFFLTEDGEKHKLEVWNERINNSPIIKAIAKDGIAIVIDGIPVQNSLADPITNLTKPKILLWILTFYYFIISLIFPLSSFKEGIPQEFLFQFIIYIVLFLVIVVATISFAKNPIRSIYSAIIPVFVDLGLSIYMGMLGNNLTLLVIIFISIKIAVLLALFYSTKNIKQILDEDIQSNSLDTNIIREKINNGFKSYSKKIIIAFSVIIILGGGYFTINKFIEKLKFPSIERDSSIELLTDLKLPELIPFRKGDKWGYCDRNKNIIIDPEYTEVEYLNNVRELIKVSVNDRWGVIDFKNNKVIPCIYDYIEKHDSLKIFLVKKGLYGLINLKNEIMIPLNYDRLSFVNNHLIGSINKNIKKYSQILSIDNGILFESDKFSIDGSISENVFVVSGWKKEFNGFEYTDKRYNGLIDKYGKQILPIENDITLLNPFSERDCYVISKKDYSQSEKYSEEMGISLEKANAIAPTKYGLINSLGTIIIPVIYDQMDWNYKRPKYIRVNKNDKWGISNLSNEQILPLVYDILNISKYNEEYFFCLSDDSHKGMGIINESGEAIFPFKYDAVYLNETNAEKLFSIQKNNRHGVVNLNQEIIVPPIYNDVVVYKDFAKVKLIEPDTLESILTSKNLYGQNFIDELHYGLKYGQEYIGISRNPFYEFSNRTAEDLKNYLLINENRKKFYEDNKYYIRYYVNSFEAFQIGIVLANRYNWYDLPGKYGFYNKNGKLIVDFLYDDANNFEDGFAEVSLNAKWGVIDTKGDEVIRIVYEKIEYIDKGMYKVKFNNKWGMINSKDQVVISLIYDKLEFIKEFDLVKVESDGKKGYIDFNGVEYFDE